jgi:hypothetical protein
MEWIRTDRNSGIDLIYSAERVQAFVDAGLLEPNEVPTLHQIRCAGSEMVPRVIVPYSEDQERYKGTELGPSPPKRFLALLKELGWNHLISDAGFGISLDCIAKHVNTHLHPGRIPIYDLQLAQTHPDGLGYVRDLTERISLGKEEEALRIRILAERIIPDAQRYRDDLIRYIDQAERFNYKLETPEVVDKEYFDLLSFLKHAQADFPERKTSAQRAMGPLFYTFRAVRASINLI